MSIKQLTTRTLIALGHVAAVRSAFNAVTCVVRSSAAGPYVASSSWM